MGWVDSEGVGYLRAFVHQFSSGRAWVMPRVHAAPYAVCCAGQGNVVVTGRPIKPENLSYVVAPPRGFAIFCFWLGLIVRGQ